MLGSSCNKIIAIDCDGVIVETCKMWERYLLGSFGLKYPAQYITKDPLPYDLTSLFKIPDGQDPYEWWYSYDLYDNLTPREDALQWISKLHHEGYTIIFVSTVIGYHHSSKENFINKWFPYNKGVILTDKKQFVDCDYLIDDCYKNLNLMKPNVKGIKFRMDYKEDSPIREFPIVYNWEDCYKLIKEDN